MQDLPKDNFTGKNEGALLPNISLKYLTASSVIGDKVANRQGDDLGEIKDIMLDINTGNIHYYVVEFGGFLGIGVKYFAIPFRLLKVDAENKRFLFNQSKKDLEKAPGFDMDHWPDTNIHFEEATGYWSFMGNDGLDD